MPRKRPVASSEEPRSNNEQAINDLYSASVLRHVHPYMSGVLPHMAGNNPMLPNGAAFVHAGAAHYSASHSHAMHAVLQHNGAYAAEAEVKRRRLQHVRGRNLSLLL